MRTLTIKLERNQHDWLQRQARASKRSKSAVIRELIGRLQKEENCSIAQALADLRGCLKGSKDLSARPLKGYGRNS